MAEERKWRYQRQSTLVWVLTALTIVFINNIDLGYGFGANQIVSKSDSFSGDCEHPNGSIMADGEHSSSGGCDAYICHREISGNYYVYLKCPSLAGNYNPDPTNCVEVSNSSLSFPSCCPTLQCSTAAPIATSSPLCFDRSSDYACGIWSSLTSGCTDYSVYRLQNFTTVFCEKTCGIC